MFMFTCEELVPYLHGTTTYQNICCFSCSKCPRLAKSQKFTDIFLHLDNMNQRLLFWAEALQEAPAAKVNEWSFSCQTRHRECHRFPKLGSSSHPESR